MTDDIQTLFAEAAAKKKQHDGAKLTINGQPFTLWPTRFTYRQRLELGQTTGFTPNSLLMNFASGDNTATIEAFAAFVAMSTYQTGDLKLAQLDMDNIVAYIEDAIYNGDPDTIEVEILRPDDGRTPDDGDATLVPAESPDAGPNGSGQ